MKRTLEVLNELEREGVFTRYAIGGAMAATFYTEPVLTFDLDVFVLLQSSATGLVSLAPIYDALRTRGYKEEQECILIEGVPVQFLPAYNALIEEALAQAREIDYEGVPARVVRAEHLIAICLQTGRAKYSQRLCAIFHAGCVLCAGKKWREPSAVVYVKMRDPDGVEVWPVEPEGGGPRRNGRRAVKQHITAARFEPVARAGACRMGHGRARADDRESHIDMID